MFDYESEVTKRFLEYVRIDTTSDEESETFPSTHNQFNLARLLVAQLKEMGVKDAEVDEAYGYVYAHIPSNRKTENNADYCLGFIAHMDTSPEVTGKNVKPQLHKNYDGKDIILGIEQEPKDKDISKAGHECKYSNINEKSTKSIILSVETFPELKEYIGKDIITTDGTTLLGADDKAGVAEIMTMVQYIMTHQEIEHGDIAIAFTPDEEVGRGMDFFDVKRFGADYAYTVDGGKLGELEYENFNAAKASITIKGRSVHPGSAKNKMLNAALLAMEFENMLPNDEKPEHTENYEGFYHLIHIKGSVEEAELQYIIRDHDKEKFEIKKKTISEISRYLNEKYGAGTFDITISDQYYNMKEKIEPCKFLITKAKEIMINLGVNPIVSPIRGGTDGARLSYMGVPCPNLCTGGHNYHGRYEYCCVQSMAKTVEILIELAKCKLK